MNLQTGGKDLRIDLTGDSGSLTVASEYSGYVLEASTPLRECLFIADWEYTPEMPGAATSRWRSILLLPEINTRAWLEDYVMQQEEKHVRLLALSPVASVQLADYQPDTVYRDFITGLGPKPDWYSIGRIRRR